MSVALPRQTIRTRVVDAMSGWLYLTPSIVLFGVFLVYPLFRTIYLSFFQTDTQGTPLSFVGRPIMRRCLRVRDFGKAYKRLLDSSC